MTRLRWRLARWLVGNFVDLPDEEGVWIVTQSDGGRVKAVFQADQFRLKTGINLAHDKTFGDFAALERYGMAKRWGRFVGTVKYQ